MSDLQLTPELMLSALRDAEFYIAVPKLKPLANVANTIYSKIEKMATTAGCSTCQKRKLETLRMSLVDKLIDILQQLKAREDWETINQIKLYFTKEENSTIHFSYAGPCTKRKVVQFNY